MSSILEFRDVSKIYGDEKTKADALKGINLKIQKNSFNLILGASGSGKSTLLNLASLLDSPTEGEVLIKGKVTSEMSKSGKSRFRRDEIGIIYQRDNLFSYLNILENVMTPMITKDKVNAIEMLKIADLLDINQFPHELPVVDQQKVAITRAVINNPSLLLADEPTGELNSEDTEDVMNLIKDFGGNRAFLIASNNPDLTKYCDNIFTLKDGILTSFH